MNFKFKQINRNRRVENERANVIKVRVEKQRNITKYMPVLLKLVTLKRL